MPVVKKVSTSLKLPIEPNKPPTGLMDYNSMIYGRKQWGKSTLASQYPDTLNFQFEPFREGLEIFQINPRTFEETLDYIGLFVEDSRFQRAVFDTVDRIYDMLLIWKCKALSNGKNVHPSEFGNEGYSVWDLVKTDFEQLFLDILDSGKKFTIISHDKIAKKKDRDGKEWERIEPTCKPAAWKIGQSMCDFVFHVDFLNGHRVVTIRDLDNATMASCNPQIKCFLDPEGNPLNRFRIGNESKESFLNLLDAFENKVYDYNYQPPKKPLTSKPLKKPTPAMQSA